MKLLSFLCLWLPTLSAPASQLPELKPTGNKQGVMRSLDESVTWEILTLQQPLDGKNLNGGRESYWVRVHSKTREPWFITGCYGVWKSLRLPTRN